MVNSCNFRIALDMASTVAALSLKYPRFLVVLRVTCLVSFFSVATEPNKLI